jgi:tetratricopeptide repeat protein
MVEDKDTEPSYSDIYRLDEVFHGWMDRKESLRMTSQDIQALLKELPFDQGQEHTEEALEELLGKGRIPSKEAKSLIQEIVRLRFEFADALGQEAEMWREDGFSYIAQPIEAAKDVLVEDSWLSLTAFYEMYQEEAQEREKLLLWSLIRAAQLQFSLEEVGGFYERLMALNPDREQHLDYARFLRRTNNYEKARIHYEKAIQELRELIAKGKEWFREDLAFTLYDLGTLLVECNEDQQARACCEEALQIYRELAEQKPEIHKSNVAAILNYMALLAKEDSECEQSQTRWEEALQISML